MADQSPVLAVNGLRFAYDEKVIVNVDDCTLQAGQSMAVIGPSGCGKTTFLHLLAGLLKPTAGGVEILGQELNSLGAAQLDRFRGEHVGMVFQRLLLMPALTVRENVELAQQMARKPKDSERVDSLLEQLGLSEWQHSKPRMISQGQAQRVAIARALVHGPALVLADEPTSALDDDRADAALSLLKDAAEAAGAALLVVTHDQRVRGQLGQEMEMESIT